jgi:hypothetical protein
MRFTLLNTVPQGLCRKLHILAPGGQLDDLAAITRDDLQRADLSPTHMELIQGLADWRDHGIPPTLGLVLWYFETIQHDDGTFRRTTDTTTPSIGLPIRLLQAAGTIGLDTDSAALIYDSATWLTHQLEPDGRLEMPATGLLDHGQQARALRSLHLVNSLIDRSRARANLIDAQTGPSIWPSYPGGAPATGATSLILTAIATEPGHYDCTPDPTWLLEAQNPHGGWGEHPGSPTQVDNTFWATRALLHLGAEIPDQIPQWLARFQPTTGYETAMTARLQTLLGQHHESDNIERLTLASLDERADRYSQTCLYALALAEIAAQRPADSTHTAGRLPIRTPEFIRREPPIYDQLAEITTRTWWLRTTNKLARARLMESAVGWLVGTSAALAVLSGELLAGLRSLPTLVLLPLLIIEAILSLSWLSIRSGTGRLGGFPHFGFAILIAVGLTFLVTSPPDAAMDVAPALALTAILTLIIDGVAVATDKADLLSRLDDE